MPNASFSQCWRTENIIHKNDRTQHTNIAEKYSLSLSLSLIHFYFVFRLRSSLLWGERKRMRVFGDRELSLSFLIFLCSVCVRVCVYVYVCASFREHVDVLSLALSVAVHVCVCCVLCACIVAAAKGKHCVNNNSVSPSVPCMQLYTTQVQHFLPSVTVVFFHIYYYSCSYLWFFCFRSSCVNSV